MICIHNLVCLGCVCPTPMALLANVFSYLAMLVMLRIIRFLKMRDSKKHSQFVKCYMVNGILRVSTIQNRMHYYNSQHPNAPFSCTATEDKSVYGLLFSIYNCLTKSSYAGVLRLISISYNLQSYHNSINSLARAITETDRRTIPITVTIPIYILQFNIIPNQ